MLDDLIKNLTSLSPYLVAFGIRVQKQLRLHKNNMLIMLDGWKQMLKHKYTKGFIETTRIKHSILTSQTIWTEIT
jgi:hypothetical protein